MRVEADWLRFEALTRTKSVVAAGLDLEVKDRAGEYRLSVPDLRGEEYQDLWVTGTESKHVADAAAAASGALLFVRADSLVESTPLETVQIRQLPEDEHGDLTKWDPDRAATQTKLCAVLEAFEIVELPIGVVVTAWDTVSDPTQDVSFWLQRRLPLLWQMLETRATFKVFAVSAQGGDLGDQKIVERLASHDDPAARLVDPQVRIGGDLTEPIGWLRQHGPMAGAA